MKLEYLVIAQTIGIAAFLAKELLSSNKSTMVKHTEEIIKNTLALAEFKIELKYVRESLELLPKLQRDLNEAHNKIRDYKSTNTYKQ